MTLLCEGDCRCCTGLVVPAFLSLAVPDGVLNTFVLPPCPIDPMLLKMDESPLMDTPPALNDVDDDESLLLPKSLLPKLLIFGPPPLLLLKVLVPPPPLTLPKLLFLLLLLL